MRACPERAWDFGLHAVLDNTAEVFACAKTASVAHTKADSLELSPCSGAAHFRAPGGVKPLTSGRSSQQVVARDTRCKTTGRVEKTKCSHKTWQCAVYASTTSCRRTDFFNTPRRLMACFARHGFLKRHQAPQLSRSSFVPSYRVPSAAAKRAAST